MILKANTYRRTEDTQTENDNIFLPQISNYFFYSNNIFILDKDKKELLY